MRQSFMGKGLHATVESNYFDRKYVDRSSSFGLNLKPFSRILQKIQLSICALSLLFSLLLTPHMLQLMIGRWKMRLINSANCHGEILLG
jgi:hypothetical protein